MSSVNVATYENCEYPTEHFTILVPPNPPIGKYYVLRNANPWILEV